MRSLLFLLWLTALPLNAVEITLRPEIIDRDAETVRGILKLQTGDAPPREVEFSSGRPLLADLEPGKIWTIQAKAEGYWSPTVHLFPQEGETKRLTLYRTVLASGRFLPPDDVSPEFLQATMRFRSRAKAPGVADLEDEMTCTLDDEGRFECPTPQGVFDLRLRAEGFVSHFFWEKKVQTAEDVVLGDVRLRIGSSVTGFVETSDETPLKACFVELRPKIPQRAQRAERVRSVWSTIRDTVDERGFFHLVGASGGNYDLVVEMEGFAPARLENLLVMERAEAELAETIVLERPLEVELTVEPVFDVHDRPWTIALLDDAGLPNDLGETNEKGIWLKSAAEAGQYQILISDSSGQGVHWEQIWIEPGNTSFLFSLDFQEVEGFVALGDEPLTGARLSFGGSTGAASFSTVTNEDGRYEIRVPEREHWEVDVLADEPQIMRRLRKLEPESTGGDSARLDIELPNISLEGEVVDEQPVDQPLDFHLSQAGGGFLRLRFAEAMDEDYTASKPYVVWNDRFRYDYTSLSNWAADHGIRQNPQELRIPFMPPGHYQVCLPGPSNIRDNEQICIEGILPTNGELHLSMNDQTDI